MRHILVVLALVLGLPAVAPATCSPSTAPAALDELVERVRAERLRYLFVGERHGVGPVKRFAVELAHALAADGTDVALYVEGFRVGCEPGDASCWNLARTFNDTAFATLRTEARVPVHPLDPPHRERRVERMAETLADGGETVRIALVGNTHVVHAADADAEWLVFGGVRYPRPGDLARAFAREESLTIGLELAAPGETPHGLHRDGCRYDYVLTTTEDADYWGRSMLAATDSGSAAAPTTAAPR